MLRSAILKLAEQYKVKLSQENQTVETNYDQSDFRQMAAELNNVVEGFLKRNPLPVSSTKKPSIQEKTEGQKARVAMGIIISQQDLDEYIRKLNNEISKLDQKYEDARVYAFYDTNDPRKADL